MMLKTTTDNVLQVTNTAKVTMVGASVTSGSFVWNWLGSNHNEITAICAIIGALCTIGGFAVTLIRLIKTWGKE